MLNKRGRILFEHLKKKFKNVARFGILGHKIYAISDRWMLNIYNYIKARQEYGSDVQAESEAP